MMCSSRKYSSVAVVRSFESEELIFVSDLMLTMR